MTAVEPHPDHPARRDPVLVVAPYRRDAALLQQMLFEYGIAAAICGDVETLTARLAEDGAALVLTQEALTSRIVDAVARHLAAQPNWSELPLVMLLDAEHQNSSVLTHLRSRLPSSKLTVLQRPVRALELVTAVETALAARRRQFQLRDHIVWQEELQRELAHRVKNVLANVVAIYHMTMRRSGSLQDFAAAFEGRLTALVKVHGAVVASVEPQPLVALADTVLDPYRSQAAERVDIGGPDLHVSPQHAVTLALCLHELATNAAKYGALSSPQGKVSLTWVRNVDERGGAVVVTWIETGGPAVVAPSGRGYGTRFIESAAKGSLSGKAEFAFGAGGLVCTITLPGALFEVETGIDEGAAI